MEDHPLLQAILYAVNSGGKTVEDIRWVGVKEGSCCSWQEFVDLVHRDVPITGNTFDPRTAFTVPILYVVGDGWWCQRIQIRLNDGRTSGLWVYLEPPVKTDNKLDNLRDWDNIKRLMRVKNSGAKKPKKIIN